MLLQYIDSNYHNSEHWFMNEVKKWHHQQRIRDILDNKEYLSGKHKINLRPNEYYNGKVYESRKIVLQYAKTILNFQANYLLAKPVTLVGSQDVVDVFNKVYKKGKYNRIDYDVLDNLIKYGNAYEYVYAKNGVITSKILDPADCYPVYDHRNELVCLIEYYTGIDNISRYVIYMEDSVEIWDNEGGKLYFKGGFPNIGGLPVVYTNNNELDPCFGRSELDDIIPILDNMEDILSKFSDSFYKHHNPIPVAIGQKLSDGVLAPELVGGGINLDDGSDFKMISNQLDYKGFESIYATLKQALLDISSTPAVSLNSQDISNLSEVSIKLLFSLADVKASLNEKYMREGIDQRFSKIRHILELQDTVIDDDDYDTLDVVFSYARPRNEQDIIADIETLRNIGALSLESALSHSPYTSDVYQELERLQAEGVGQDDEGKDDGKDIRKDSKKGKEE